MILISALGVFFKDNKDNRNNSLIVFFLSFIFFLRLSFTRKFKNCLYCLYWAQWKFSGDKHKSLQVDTERTFHQRYPLAML